MTTSGDPGARTQQRYSYQNYWIGIFALQMYESEDIEFIACEKEDDFSIKFQNPSDKSIKIFQVTYSNSKLSPNSRKFIKSLKNFCNLETIDRNISEYIILTNCPKTKTKKMNGKNSVSFDDIFDLNYKSFINTKLKELEDEFDYEDIIKQVLKKTKIQTDHNYKYLVIRNLFHTKLEEILSKNQNLNNISLEDVDNLHNKILKTIQDKSQFDKISYDEYPTLFIKTQFEQNKMFKDRIYYRNEIVDLFNKFKPRYILTNLDPSLLGLDATNIKYVKSLQLALRPRQFHYLLPHQLPCF